MDTDTDKKTYALTATRFGVIYTTASHTMGEQVFPRGIDADQLDKGEPTQWLTDGHGIQWLRTDFGDSGMGWMIDDPDSEDEHPDQIDATEVKFCTLLTFEQFGTLMDDLYLYGAEQTAGALGMPEPNLDDTDPPFYTGWSFMPAFSMDASDYNYIGNAYVTPYLFTADGQPVMELDEDAFDKVVSQLRQHFNF